MPVESERMLPVFAVAFLALSPCAFAAESGFPEGGDLAQMASDPELAAIGARIASELSSAGLLGMSGEEAAEFARSRALIVMGSNLDGPEKAFYEAAKAKYPFLDDVATVPDDSDALAKIGSGSYSYVILVGGPGQNFVTKEAISRLWLNETETAVRGQVIVQYGRAGATGLLAISDARGYSNANREGAKYSPLALLGLPVQYVPAAATILSVIILALWELARTVFEFKALDIGRKGKKVGQGAWMLFGINFREALSFPAAALVLGASISWQFFGPSWDFVFWLFVNSIICGVAALVHEATHRAFAWAFGIRMEYRFWPAGSFFTLLSSFLGNAFSVQAYLLEDVDEKIPKWKVAATKLSAPLVSAFFMVAFAAINFFFPHTVFQMVTAISALWAMAEMLPFRGLDGSDLIRINFFAWLLPFTAIACCYVMVTFIL